MKRLFAFLIMPLIFILSGASYVNSINEFIGCVVFVVIEFLIGAIVYWRFNRLKKQNSASGFGAVVGIAVSVIIDQTIKLIVHYTNISGKIVGVWLQIKPTKNVHQAAILDLWSIKWDTYTIIILKILLVILLMIISYMLRKKELEIRFSLSLLIAAGIATVLDSALWGYTLDYIYFYNITCYDLKDFYVDIAIGFIILDLFKNDMNCKTVNALSKNN